MNGPGRKDTARGPGADAVDAAPITHSWAVTQEDSGARLDVHLSRRIAELGRTAARELCARGLVAVNGRRPRKSAVLEAGQLIEVRLEDALGHARPEPESPLEVMLESDALVVANKPAGLPAGALPFRVAPTLAGALLGRYPELGGVGYGPREPGLVHRLDTWTSGLVLAARSASSFSHLRAALERGELDKRYLALTGRGIPERGEVDIPLVQDPKNSRRVIAAPRGAGHVCFTAYERLEVRGELALVGVRIAAGFRHQIRAHLSLAGFPLAGDALYGGPPLPGSGLRAVERHALHASQITGIGADGAEFSACAPLPEDLREAFFGSG